jgi:hypothetical protein
MILVSVVHIEPGYPVFASTTPDPWNQPAFALEYFLWTPGQQ